MTLPSSVFPILIAVNTDKGNEFVIAVKKRNINERRMVDASNSVFAAKYNQFTSIACIGI